MDDEIKIAIALDGKISQLVDLYENEKEKALMLSNKVSRLNEQIETLETEIEKLKETNSTLKLATAFKSIGDASDAKRIIDELVREIDECMILLNE